MTPDEAQKLLNDEEAFYSEDSNNWDTSYGDSKIYGWLDTINAIRNDNYTYTVTYPNVEDLELIFSPDNKISIIAQTDKEVLFREIDDPNNLYNFINNNL